MISASLHGLAAGVEGFFFLSSSGRQKNQQVGEVSANPQIAVNSVTHERIERQLLETSELFYEEKTDPLGE